MGIQLNKDLEGAATAIKAATKAGKQLATVGVSAAEIAAMKKRLATVLAERKKHIAAAAAAHDETHDKHAVVAEGMSLVEHPRAAAAMVLRRDHPEAPSELSERAGIGAQFDKSPAKLAQVAQSLVDAAKDARWKKPLAKRGFTAAAQKRLAEIAHVLDGAAPFSVGDDPALTDDTRALLRDVSYLREAALRVFGAHSPAYAPFRARAPRPHKPAAPPPA